MNDRTIVLISLKPVEAYLDQIIISRECKFRKKQSSIKKIEKN